MDGLSFVDRASGEDKTEAARAIMREKAPELLQMMAQVRAIVYEYSFGLRGGGRCFFSREGVSFRTRRCVPMGFVFLEGVSRVWFFTPTQGAFILE